ncbi:glycosyltransferase family 2 protein [Gaetbulibacter sp. M235]|uniref:glycosyltransferase family 2 protein n=1 Tax=Gaetbulibacter sp. M235 TaxID=3126510 RepID=UPI00374FB9EE
MKFSIIVPTYNLEKYIERCIGSLLNQNLKIDEYEILIINDGSTDQTQAKVLKYTKNHSNLILHNKINGGVSSARNFGKDKAKGEYLLFVDGDDWLCENVLSKIYYDIKTNNLEIARFGYISIFDKKQEKKYIVSKKNDNPITGLEFITNYKINEFRPWAYVISNKFLFNYNLSFNESLSYCEDKEFMIRALSLTKRFQNFDYVHYNYSIFREGSATAVYSDKHLEDLIRSNIYIYEFSKTINTNKKYQNYIKFLSVNSLLKSYYTLTLVSMWEKFWIWNNILKSSYLFKNYISKDSFQLTLLKNNSFVFYLIYYFPRALYHKLKFQN